MGRNTINTGKKYKTKPSLRAKKVAQILAEKGGTLGNAIREAGYSETVAITPAKLTKTKTWDELMEEFLPESLVASVHHEQLSATRPVVVDKQIVMKSDNDARLRAADMAYKLRGKYAPEQINLTRRKYQDLSNADLMALQNKLKNHLQKK